MKGESVDFHDQETVQQEIHPPDAGQRHLGLEIDPIAPKEMLCVDFHYRFCPQVKLLHRASNGPRAVTVYLGPE
ncbi:hypothetical protein [Pseudarthrobacter sp. CCNWLW207]|uniref:hypothetical protein n=1 Tax=Pseudarthrobacter sp. CCNWLW207 TaxID=3127468 RepID=UPI003076F48E